MKTIYEKKGVSWQNFQNRWKWCRIIRMREMFQIKDESLWVTQKAMTKLFGIDKSGISRYLKNIFDTAELDEKMAVAKIASNTQHGAIEGKTQTSAAEINYKSADYKKSIWV